MNTPSRFQTIRRLWKAEFFSAKDFVIRALFIAVLFAAAHLAGLREYTSFLSGTSANTDLSRETVAFLGVGYVLLYFAFLLLVPILLIAAALLWGWQKYQAKNS